MKIAWKGWFVLFLVLGVMDLMTYATAPQDAFNPFHPHPHNWTYKGKS